LTSLPFKTRHALAIIIFCCLGIVFSMAPAMADDTDKDAAKDQVKEKILAAMEKKYAGKSFEANFTQVSTLAALEIIETASGKALFSHPGRMKWQYLEPEQHEIITNGKTLWIHRPDENQVMTGDASSFFKSGAGGSFLSDISLMKENYSIQVRAVTTDFAEIDLTPKKKTPDIARIVIRVSQKNHEITKVLTYNEFDDTTLFEFDSIQFKTIDPDEFEFTPPEGLNIIKMD
jgi:outer membrane lipoprotein carrier protein